jgi:hypothetical protein
MTDNPPRNIHAIRTAASSGYLSAKRCIEGLRHRERTELVDGAQRKAEQAAELLLAVSNDLARIDIAVPYPPIGHERDPRFDDEMDKYERGLET